MSTESATLQEVLDESDLVCHLRAAEHRHQRPSGSLEDPCQRANLALHQASGGTGQQVGDSLGAGVRPVGGAERVVDIYVCQLGERPGELGIVLGLPGLVADVLEHQDLARGRRSVSAFTSSPTTAGARLTCAPVSSLTLSATGRIDSSGSRSWGAPDVRPARSRAPPSQFLDRVSAARIRVSSTIYGAAPGLFAAGR